MLNVIIVVVVVVGVVFWRNFWMGVRELCVNVWNAAREVLEVRLQCVGLVKHDAHHDEGECYEVEFALDLQAEQAQEEQ